MADGRRGGICPTGRSACGAEEMEEGEDLKGVQPKHSRRMRGGGQHKQRAVSTYKTPACAMRRSAPRIAALEQEGHVWAQRQEWWIDVVTIEVEGLTKQKKLISAMVGN